MIMKMSFLLEILALFVLSVASVCFQASAVYKTKSNLALSG